MYLYIYIVLYNLHFNERVDFLILLYCYKEFNIPSQIVSEALTVTLLKSSIKQYRDEYGLIPVTRELVKYPTALISLIIYKLYQSCIEYINDSKTEYNSKKRYTHLDIELMNTVPILFPFSLIKLNHEFPRIKKYNHSLRYQHCCCIICRSPSCPPFVDVDKIKIGRIKSYYRKLYYIKYILDYHY